jgi:UDP-N-acetyl-D-glucosamine dehydrogenase
VVAKLQRLLNQRGHCLNGAKIFVLGVTYKADVADPRETPALKVMELLQREGAALTYADPYVPHMDVEGRSYAAVGITADRLAQSDCALILTAHSAFDYDLIVRHARVVFDTRNGARHVKTNRSHVVLL